jgi:hypothetical protein
VEEYIAGYPEYATQIEDLFPVIAMLERLRIEEMAKRQAARRRPESKSPPTGIGDRGASPD